MGAGRREGQQEPCPCLTQGPEYLRLGMARPCLDAEALTHVFSSWRELRPFPRLP